MELRQIRYFMALADELHFGKAAARMHMTQPPLSKQIQQLERELGVVLFARTNKEVRLTEAGKIFLKHATQLQNLLVSTISATQRAARGEIGRLTIGYLASAAYYLLPKVLRYFRKTCPEIELSLRSMMTQEQLEALLRGDIDIGIMRPMSAQRQLQSEVILRERFVVALPEEHVLARRKTIHISSLANEKFVMLLASPERHLSRQILDLCLRAGVEPRVVQAAGETRSIVGLIGAGIGVSILPVSIESMRISGVVYRTLTGVADRAEMAVVWRKDSETPVVSQFLSTVRGRPLSQLSLP